MSKSSKRRVCTKCSQVFASQSSLWVHSKRSRFCVPPPISSTDDTPLLLLPNVPVPQLPPAPHYSTNNNYISNESSLFAQALPDQSSDECDISSGFELKASHDVSLMDDDVGVTSPKRPYQFAPWLHDDHLSPFPPVDRFFGRDSDVASNDSHDTGSSDSSFNSDFLPLPGPGSTLDDGTPIDYNHMYQSSKYCDLDDGTIHPAAERLLNYIKLKSLPPAVYDFVNDWAKEWSTQGYKFESPCARTLMHRMKKKYVKYTGTPPRNNLRTPPRSPTTISYQHV